MPRSVSLIRKACAEPQSVAHWVGCLHRMQGQPAYRGAAEKNSPASPLPSGASPN